MMTAVIYQTFTVLITLETSLIAIRHLRGLRYMANIPRLRAALSRGILTIYHTSSGLIA